MVYLLKYVSFECFKTEERRKMNKIFDAGKDGNIFNGEFEFIDSGFSSGKYNMDFDIERTSLVSAGKALPMFRVYGWQPWCVSLGANQKESDILDEECAKRNFEIVRRPTGGRAVLHANEITYSVVVPMRDNVTVHDIYREVHVVLLKALQKMGCKSLDFEKSQPDFRDVYSRETVSVACFASSARYEIESGGRKLVGSAQRLIGDTLLQHGSILIGSGHEQLAYISRVKSEDSRAVLLDYILKHSVTIEELLGREVSYEETADAIFEYFNQ